MVIPYLCLSLAALSCFLFNAVSVGDVVAYSIALNLSDLSFSLFFFKSVLSTFVVKLSLEAARASFLA